MILEIPVKIFSVLWVTVQTWIISVLWVTVQTGIIALCSFGIWMGRIQVIWSCYIDQWYLIFRTSIPHENWELGVLFYPEHFQSVV